MIKNLGLLIQLLVILALSATAVGVALVASGAAASPLFGAPISTTIQTDLLPGDVNSITCPTMLVVDVINAGLIDVLCDTGSTQTPTVTPTPTLTPTATLSPTATPTQTPLPTATQTVAPTATTTPTDTPEPPLFVGFATIGDSNTDSYQAEDNRGWNYHSVSFSWVDSLVHSGYNFGGWGYYGEPRRTDYEFSWSRSGATSEKINSTNANDNQVNGVAAQVAAGEADVVFIYIGTNDFRTGGGLTSKYGQIYSGAMTDFKLAEKIDKFEDTIELTVNLLQSANPDVQVLLVTVSDPGNQPQTVIDFPNAAGRQRVTDAINDLNTRFAAIATTHDIALAEMITWENDLLAQAAANGNGYIYVDGVGINLAGRCDEPTCAVLSDRHPGTVLGGLLGNFFVETINSYYGTDYYVLSEHDIIVLAGLD